MTNLEQRVLRILQRRMDAVKTWRENNDTWIVSPRPTSNKGWSLYDIDGEIAMAEDIVGKRVVIDKHNKVSFGESFDNTIY